VIIMIVINDDGLVAKRVRLPRSLDAADLIVLFVAGGKSSHKGIQLW